MAESKRKELVRKAFGWLVFLALAGAPVAYFYTREPVIDVTVMTLTLGRVEQTIAAISAGTVEPKQASMVTAETIGKVVGVPVEEGARVNEGDVLVELDCKQQAYQVTLAETRLRQISTGVELLKHQYDHDQSRIPTMQRTRDVADIEFQRDKTLFEKHEVGTETMVHFSEVNFNQADDTYRMVTDAIELYPLRIHEAEAGLAATSTMLDQAKTSLDWTKVRAPFAGVVANIYVDVGESIGSGLGGDASGGALGAGLGAGGAGMSGGGAGMSMGSAGAVAYIVDDSDLYVKAPFDEANAGQIKIGQKARITIDAYRGEEFPGRVEFISPTVTRNLDLSRTFEVDVLIEQGKEKFVPGMSADVIIVADAKDEVLIVPSETLVREEEGYVIEEGRAVRRKVKIGIGNWLSREVLEGLRAGETLITSVGLKELQNGVKVRVVESLETR